MGERFAASLLDSYVPPSTILNDARPYDLDSISNKNHASAPSYGAVFYDGHVDPIRLAKLHILGESIELIPDLEERAHAMAASLDGVYRERITDEVYTKLFGAVRKIAYGIGLRHPSRRLRELFMEGEADDVAQNVVVNIFNRIHQYDPRFRFSTWIYSITRNAIMDLAKNDRRKESTHRFSELETEAITELDKHQYNHDPHSDDPSVQIVEQERIEGIIREVKSLPHQYRKAIALSTLDASIADIARRLGVPVNTIENRLARARKKLRLDAGGISDGFKSSTEHFEELAELLEREIPYEVRLMDIPEIDVRSIPVKTPSNTPFGLSETEQQVLYLAMCGYANSYINRALGIPSDEAGKHLSAIREKMGLNGRTATYVDPVTKPLIIGRKVFPNITGPTVRVTQDALPTREQLGILHDLSGGLSHSAIASRHRISLEKVGEEERNFYRMFDIELSGSGSRNGREAKMQLVWAYDQMESEARDELISGHTNRWGVKGLVELFSHHTRVA